MKTALVLAALLASGCTLGQARLGAYVGTAADLVSTQAAVNSGLREFNPLLGESNPVLVSAVASAAILGGAYLLEPYDPKGATWFYRFVAAVRGGMAVHNLILILKNDDEPTAIDRRKRTPAPTVGFAMSF